MKDSRTEEDILCDSFLKKMSREGKSMEQQIYGCLPVTGRQDTRTRLTANTNDESFLFFFVVLNLNAILMTFLVPKCPKEKQPRRENVCFSLKFNGAVHRDGEIRTAGT